MLARPIKYHGMSYMSAKVFFDTNVLVYAYDSGEPNKQAIAQRLFDEHARQGQVVISTQVLQELYASLTRVGKQKLPMDKAADVVNFFAELPLQQIDKQLISAAMQCHQQGAFSFWDSLIVEAALRAGCSTLLSEDMHDGLQLGTLTIQNPFK